MLRVDLSRLSAWLQQNKNDDAAPMQLGIRAHDYHIDVFGRMSNLCALADSTNTQATGGSGLWPTVHADGCVAPNTQLSAVVAGADEISKPGTSDTAVHVQFAYTVAGVAAGVCSTAAAVIGSAGSARAVVSGISTAENTAPADVQAKVPLLRSVDTTWTVLLCCHCGHATSGRQVCEMKTAGCKFCLAVEHVARRTYAWGVLFWERV
ncbi:hypothetical protein COO60DRAFT_1594246 [Scenedesmus sp. NREL 46B-D3]|nr:hypothetical protein COO60DRAFT_1594246 [Scenedesmus sp. NREL 46B-D3]